jgi:hypothetical protein
VGTDPLYDVLSIQFKQFFLSKKIQSEGVRKEEVKEDREKVTE